MDKARVQLALGPAVAASGAQAITSGAVTSGGDYSDAVSITSASAS
jgi:hypothetical protein